MEKQVCYAVFYGTSGPPFDEGWSCLQHVHLTEKAAEDEINLLNKSLTKTDNNLRYFYEIVELKS